MVSLRWSTKKIFFSTVGSTCPIPCLISNLCILNSKKFFYSQLLSTYRNLHQGRFDSVYKTLNRFLVLEIRARDQPDELGIFRFEHWLRG